MDFGFFTDENLLDFFSRNKSKINTMEKPLMFLRHLKDNGLITDELYVSIILQFQTNNTSILRQKDLTIYIFAFIYLFEAKP